MTTTRILALPLLTAGILAGALGLASAAGAETTTDHAPAQHSLHATPDNVTGMPTQFHIAGERLHPHRHGGTH
jgi:hypothetical protein